MELTHFVEVLAVWIAARQPLQESMAILGCAIASLDDLAMDCTVVKILNARPGIICIMEHNIRRACLA